MLFPDRSGNSNNRDGDLGRAGRQGSVGLATRYGLEGPRVRIPVEARFFAPVHTDPGTHAVPAPGVLSGGKAAGPWR